MKEWKALYGAAIAGVIGNAVLFSIKRRRCDLLAMKQFFQFFCIVPIPLW